MAVLAALPMLFAGVKGVFPSDAMLPLWFLGLSVLALIFVGFSPGDLDQELGVVDLFDRDPSNTDIAVMTGNLHKPRQIVLGGQIFDGFQANVGVAVLPLGSKKVKKSHALGLQRSHCSAVASWK